MLGGTPEEVPERFRLFSPNTHAGPGSPPTLLIQGAHVYQRLREAGVSAGLVVLPQTDHAFDLMLPAHSPPVRAALWHLERFLSRMANPEGQA